jgi:hypothetical protein
MINAEWNFQMQQDRSYSWFTGMVVELTPIPEPTDWHSWFRRNGLNTTKNEVPPAYLISSTRISSNMVTRRLSPQPIIPAAAAYRPDVS